MGLQQMFLDSDRGIRSDLTSAASLYLRLGASVRSAAAPWRVAGICRSLSSIAARMCEKCNAYQEREQSAVAPGVLEAWKLCAK